MLKDLIDDMISDITPPWSKSDMEAMLKLGYTPEYVSLTKWVILHKHYVTTQTIDYVLLNGNTCALCDIHYQHLDTFDDDECCAGCTLFDQMGITCNHEDHPYISVRFGSINDLVPMMVEMIKQLTILVVKHGVMVDEKTK